MGGLGRGITPNEIDRFHVPVYALGCRSGLRCCEADEGRGCGCAIDDGSADKAPAAPQLCGGTKPARATVLSVHAKRTHADGKAPGVG